MNDGINFLCLVLIGFALCVGAYTDYKSRVIPNCIPVMIILCGFFLTTLAWSEKIFGLVAMIIIVATTTAITKKRSGGGDIKLYCSLCFSIGLISTALVLLVTGLILQVCRKFRNIETTAVPLCSYVAPAYLIVVILPWIVRLLDGYIIS